MSKKLSLFLAACLFLLSCNSTASEIPPDTAIEPSPYNAAETEMETEPETKADDSPIVNQFFETEYYRGKYTPSFPSPLPNSIVVKHYVKLYTTTCCRGETISLDTLAENVGAAFIQYDLYDCMQPNATLQISHIPDNPSAHEIYLLTPDPFPIPETLPRPVAYKPGKKWGLYLTFSIPANAIPGYYDVLLFSSGYETIVKNAIQILP